MNASIQTLLPILCFNGANGQADEGYCSWLCSPYGRAWCLLSVYVEDRRFLSTQWTSICWELSGKKLCTIWHSSPLQLLLCPQVVHCGSRWPHIVPMLQGHNKLLALIGWLLFLCSSSLPTLWKSPGDCHPTVSWAWTPNNSSQSETAINDSYILGTWDGLCYPKLWLLCRKN